MAWTPELEEAVRRAAELQAEIDEDRKPRRRRRLSDTLEGWALCVLLFCSGSLALAGPWYSRLVWTLAGAYALAQLARHFKRRPLRPRSPYQGRFIKRGSR